MKTKQLLLFFTILTIFSCKENVKKSLLVKEDKFTLPIGNMDNELDFFSREGVQFSLKSDIAMKNGLFYISNGNGKKVMKFNSYGNLLNKISPSRQSESSHYDGSWTFNQLGSIAINSKDYIYTEDTIEYEVAFVDDFIDKSGDLTDKKDDYNSHILNEKIVSIFDNEGRYINYIGQEGLAGTPFPFIYDLFVDSMDRVIVITQTTYYWSVYRFSNEGDLIDRHNIDLDNLPQLEDKEDGITQINSIKPDRDKERVLVELTFYKKIYEEKTGAVVSMELETSRVYYYDLKTGSYISWMEIPTRINEESGFEMPNTLLDIVKGKYLYFISLSENGKSNFLTITNENGYIIGTYDLKVDNSNIIYSSYYTSYKDGILAGLHCTDYAGAITLWRTDKILEEDNK